MKSKDSKKDAVKPIEQFNLPFVKVGAPARPVKFVESEWIKDIMSRPLGAREVSC